MYAYLHSPNCIRSISETKNKTRDKSENRTKSRAYNGDIIDTESYYLKPLKAFLNPDLINQ